MTHSEFTLAWSNYAADYVSIIPTSESIIKQTKNWSAFIEKKGWKVTGEVRLSYYDCVLQEVNFETSDVLERISWRGRIRLEKELGKEVKLFGEYAYEEDDSNRRESEYNQNSIFFGIDKAF